jgi:hypothetical protein
LAIRSGRNEDPKNATVRRADKRPLSVFALPLPRNTDAPFPTVRRAAVALIVVDPELEAAVDEPRSG